MKRLSDVQIHILAARTLIADPADWTQGVWARDAAGRDVDSTSPKAVCWCAEGAEMFVLDPIEPTPMDKRGKFAFEYLNEAALKLGYRNLALPNDTTNHATVMLMYDMALEAAG